MRKNGWQKGNAWVSLLRRGALAPVRINKTQQETS
jgi:hypothetical protein